MTFEKVVQTSSGKLLVEGSCLSTEDKPKSTIANGSVLKEMDTATVYLFDETNQTWRAWE